MSRAEKAEIEARIAAAVARKRDRGEPMVPVGVERRRGLVAGTFWGHAWCERMESAVDYRDRLPMGRSRLRAGAVYDLSIAPREVFAYVAGEELHEVIVRIRPLAPDRAEALAASCGGKIGSLVDLLTGNLSPEVLQTLVDPEHGLIPGPDEIRFDCDCPDHAGLCAHGAAVLYAVGARLDEEPALLFTLREFAFDALLSGVVSAAAEVTQGDQAGAGPELAGEDLAALFGIELTDEG